MNLHFSEQDARIVIDALRREHAYITEVAEPDNARAARIEAILDGMGEALAAPDTEYVAAGDELGDNPLKAMGFKPEGF